MSKLLRQFAACYHSKRVLIIIPANNLKFVLKVKLQACCALLLTHVLMENHVSCCEHVCTLFYQRRSMLPAINNRTLFHDLLNNGSLFTTSDNENNLHVMSTVGQGRRKLTKAYGQCLHHLRGSQSVTCSALQCYVLTSDQTTLGQIITTPPAGNQNAYVHQTHVRCSSQFLPACRQLADTQPTTRYINLQVHSNNSD